MCTHYTHVNYYVFVYMSAWSLSGLGAQGRPGELPGAPRGSPRFPGVPWGPQGSQGLPGVPWGSPGC